jgi:hypothetical protein
MDELRAILARNEIRLDMKELAAELRQLEAQAMVEQGRASPARQKGPVSGVDDDEAKKLLNPAVATTNAGMVAQQMEASRRFEKNSEVMERQRKAQNKPGNDGAPVPATTRDNTKTLPQTKRDAVWLRGDDALRRTIDDARKQAKENGKEKEPDRGKDRER